MKSGHRVSIPSFIYLYFSFVSVVLQPRDHYLAEHMNFSLHLRKEQIIL